MQCYIPPIAHKAMPLVSLLCVGVLAMSLSRRAFSSPPPSPSPLPPGPLLERAIGVIYRPDTERQSHYFFAELPAQFDLVVHIDHTKGAPRPSSCTGACLANGGKLAEHQKQLEVDAMACLSVGAAVTPLDTPKHPSWEAEVEATEDFPETYPFGV